MTSPGPADPSPASISLAHGELAPPGEANAIRTIVKAIETRVRAHALTGPARRDAHPKAHGCVRARFEVAAGLPAALAVGVFGRPRVFDAWIRFSNGAEKPGPDRLGDGRGMAVKLMGVEDSPSTTQDFVMINHPAFFVRNAVDYVDFQTAANPLRFFFPGFNPFRWRLRELMVARAITARKVQNPLNIRYWSMTPYALAGAVCKYSARPSGTPSSFVATDTADFLHDNLRAHLAVADASFDFLAQARAPAGPALVEDPTATWDEANSPFVTVARIVIPRQDFDTERGRAFCEALSFTPWHGLEAHRPLGGINRVRRVVYETISRLRHDLNNQPRREPTPEPGESQGDRS
jgi:hypothetical protein